MVAYKCENYGPEEFLFRLAPRPRRDHLISQFTPKYAQEDLGIDIPSAMPATEGI
jgi:hypothetical protein